MFEKVTGADFLRGEHEVLRFWQKADVFKKLRAKNAGKPRWSFLDGPITANNPMGVHHAWGRTYKDAYQRFFAMTGHDLRYQNGFDCQGLWVEVEVERELKLTTKPAIEDFGIDKFVNACKRRVLQFAARQTEQSIRLGYWMDWDDPETLRKLARHVGTDEPVTITTPSGKTETDQSHRLVAKLGCAEWGGSYFTFSTENNETIWAFLKKCHERGKIYSGHDVMPWSGQAGSAYSQMEVADGRRLTTHRSCFVRFPLADAENEFLLVWTTTPWTLTSNVACAVNPDLDYVKIRTTRDNAVYYFAKDNLNFQRLEREFKEGFGRPEWDWPKGTPKLKTIAQIFKEQGGFETVETLKGAALIGRPYQGPFDDLPAQNAGGGVPFNAALAGKTGVNCHRVIDGGRDSKGSPNVVAGEGTGIVHIAPGCGDVDHVLGEQHGLVGIAPLDESGRFVEGFGPFTGKDATDPETVQLVFDTLKAKHRLVTVEEYPHIYPFCWRTGVELVFRLVDEWFINMDWREEIKDVTRQIRWLPPSINGQERELEWLSNMRDWMISKKRFWGLALPFWVDDVTGEFEVIGSLAELKVRAVEGWNGFEGHTPHRPWIDRVKIRNPRSGNLMSRVRDVGNPWLDAGIVPFSTLQYNTDRDAWRKLYPPDLVLECFPGQFRNWFYSLLSMGTMMDGSPPFQTLFGHRLVMNEEGKPMHKTDGTAIWFEEAAEQLGVDTIRWMYLAQNPAADLRFGTRHSNRPVTLQTPEGAIDQTKEGAPTCEVVSKPADEIRRQVLIPLWNSYAFFINYARLDNFDPRAPLVPVAERPEIDRWLLSNLQALTATTNREFAEFNAQEVCRAAAGFIDDLSNWYIRRNRRRFWRSRDAGDRDKLAAYQTLYHALLELTKLLAPLIPFLTERMYGNLRVDGPESVHLRDYPTPDQALLDPELNRRMAAAQRLVGLGHKLRDDANIRVRQPLAEVRFSATDPSQAEAIEHLAEVVKEELNVKRLTRADNLDGLAKYTFKPNLKTLGPKYGKLLGAIGKALASSDPAVLAPLRRGESVTLQIGGADVVLMPEDVLVSTENTPGWVTTAEGTLQLALSTELSPELIREGMARDFVRHVQQLRKEADLEIEDRIAIYFQSDEAVIATALTEWAEYIRAETQADTIEPSSAAPADAKTALIGETKLLVWIVKK
jgi:isoleucyl-tRNA synthetase